MLPPDDTLFVVISNAALTAPNPSTKAAYTFRIRVARGGRIAAPFLERTLVNSTSGLVQATARRKPALLVYRLDAGDLRTLKLTLVPASSLELKP